MGGKVSAFVGSVAKAAAKGVISYAGGHIPLIGGPLANYINSKFAKGSFDVGAPAVSSDLPTKVVSTPAQLTALVKQFPDQASKAGLTVEMIKDEVKEAKAQSKAVGGAVKMKMKKDAARPKSCSDKGYAKGTKALKAKKPRTPAQLEATRKLVEANKARRAKK